MMCGSRMQICAEGRQWDAFDPISALKLLLNVVSSLASTPGSAIAHPATRRHRGPLLTAYLVFCAVRGALQLTAVWFYGEIVPHAGASAGVGPVGLLLAAAGATNALGALALWQWSGAGAVMLALSAVATMGAGVLAGWNASVVLGAAMLVAAGVTLVAGPWRLSCLRCRAPLAITDAFCPSCGQAFSD
jgi:hypothetical protein